MLYFATLIIYYIFASFEWSIFLIPFLHISWLYTWKTNSYSKSISLPYLLLFTLPLIFFLSPNFENDFYRYFIESIHVLKNYSPYQISPLESPLHHQFAKIIQKVGFPSYESIYSPLTLIYFSGINFFSNLNLDLFIILLRLSYLLSLFISFKLLNQFSENFIKNKETLFFLLHPMFLLECFQNLHFEPIIILFLALFLKHNNLFFLSTLFHFRFYYLFIFMFSSYSSIKSYFSIVFYLGLTFIVTSFLFNLNAQEWLYNLKAFSLEWEMNSGLYRWIRNTIYFFSQDAKLSIFLTKILIINFLIIFYFFLLKKKVSLLTKLALFLNFFLLTMPVVNPWYFTPLLFLNFFVKKEKQLPIFLTCLTLNFYYLFYIIPRQLERLPGLWLDFEHILLWCLLFYTLNIFLNDRIKIKQTS